MGATADKICWGEQLSSMEILETLPLSSPPFIPSFLLVNKANIKQIRNNEYFLQNYFT
jgi:hypothetical protein